jgi:uncharacterized YigZ family protein
VKIILNPADCEEYIKKSRFIGAVKPCASEREALQFIHQLHTEHPTASHIVYAYRIQQPDGLICRFNDAGEPSGTAGKPIFQHLEGKQLINAALAIIRYFGGVKLGAGGLTRAYSGVARLTLEHATLSDYIEHCELRFTLEYSQLQLFEYQLKKLDGQIIAQDFADKIRLTITIPKANSEQLASFTQT